jgi:3D-(3,5/4)-trihydroxycyclohexane-1,2-dione acylhydrolase (decyclizing)
MITGAATATINRLPVLLLPGDIFAGRNATPVLQQLESASTQDISVNDCFKPVAKYWDRIQRPEQILAALPEAMRVLTSPAETGAAIICLPQDVQAEAFDCPGEFLRDRGWVIRRQRCDQQPLKQTAQAIQAEEGRSSSPAAVIFSDACESAFKVCGAMQDSGDGDPSREGLYVTIIRRHWAAPVSRAHRERTLSPWTPT